MPVYAEELFTRLRRYVREERKRYVQELIAGRFETLEDSRALVARIATLDGIEDEANKITGSSMHSDGGIDL